MPPQPKVLIGRDKEKATIISTLLLVNPPPRVAILGLGGIGKTTLALSAMYDPQVTALYPLRYFVSCETATSIETLLDEIANALQVPPASRGSSLYQLLLSTLREGKVLLCLDNFETVWDDTATRSGVEEFLSHLDEVPGLALIVTMRGTQCPRDVSWTHPRLPTLSPVSYESAVKIFTKFCHAAMDPFTEKLLSALEGLPLGIRLIATMMQEGNETSESLWERWKDTSTNSVEIGSDRLSNLDTSILLSVKSPRMREDSQAELVLAMLSLLPNGLTSNISLLQQLKSRMPSEMDLRKSLLTLQRVGLIYLDSSPTPRYRLLSPIHEFSRSRLEVPRVLDDAIRSFYVEIFREFWQTSNPVFHTLIPPELTNAHSVFMSAYASGSSYDALIIATIRYNDWMTYLSHYETDLLLLAIDNCPNTRLKGRCYQTLGDVYDRLQENVNAEQSLTKAMQLFRQIGDTQAEAKALCTLSRTKLYSGSYDAEDVGRRFEVALGLFRQAHNNEWEAGVLQDLGFRARSSR